MADRLLRLRRGHRYPLTLGLFLWEPVSTTFKVGIDTVEPKHLEAAGREMGERLRVVAEIVSTLKRRGWSAVMSDQLLMAGIDDPYQVAELVGAVRTEEKLEDLLAGMTVNLQDPEARESELRNHYVSVKDKELFANLEEPTDLTPVSAEGILELIKRMQRQRRD